MNLLSRASLFGQNDDMSKNKKETLGTRMVQTWRTISMANLKTPLFDQLPCRSEEAYSINEISKLFFIILLLLFFLFHFQKKQKKLKIIKNTVGLHYKMKD